MQLQAKQPGFVSTGIKVERGQLIRTDARKVWQNHPDFQPDSPPPSGLPASVQDSVRNLGFYRGVFRYVQNNAGQLTVAPLEKLDGRFGRIF